MKLIDVKSIAIALTLSNLMFISCDKTKINTDDKKEQIAEMVTIEKDNLDVEMPNEVNNNIEDIEITTRTYKMRDRVTPIIYDLDTTGIAGFDDWVDYTIVHYELADIKKANYIAPRERINNLNYKVANLKNTIPDWLKTEEVMEDVADIQKEYLELISELDASDKEIKENLEEVVEKFDDLREELDETVEEYIKIHEDAIEEFNEEIKKGKIAAAIEEYNEEIKKLDKIVEKK